MVVRCCPFSVVSAYGADIANLLTKVNSINGRCEFQNHTTVQAPYSNIIKWCRHNFFYIVSLLSQLVERRLQLESHSSYLLVHSTELVARDFLLIARISQLVAKYIKRNVRSQSFAEFCELKLQLQFIYCLDAGTGFLLLS